MRMSQATFDNLKRDFLAVVDGIQADTGRPFNYSTMSAAWDVFHFVHACRHYDDAHPMWAHQRRHVPYVGNAREHEAFYNAGLNDAHIETALRKIVSA